MTWVPTPPEEIPDPEVILGHLQPGPGEGPTGFIRAADLTAITQALLSISYVIAAQGDSQLRHEIGDPSTLTEGVPEHDLVHYLLRLEARVAALEPQPPPTPTIEGSLQVDNYGGGFIRVRDVDGLLADGGLHVVNFVLATVAGPGGEVIDPATGVPAGPNPVWFDRNGTLGYVKGQTGTNTNQTTMRNWCRYPDDYAITVELGDDPTEPTKPLLTIDHVESLP